MKMHSKYQHISMIHLLIFFVAMVPFSTSLFAVNSFELAEIAVPLIFCLTLLVVSISDKEISSFLNESGNRIGLFVGLFMFVILVNYIRNPLFPSSIVGKSDDAAGGFKTYFRYLNGLMVFLLVVYWMNRKNLSAETLLRMFSWVVITIVATAFFVRVTGQSVPGLETHKWVGKITEGIGEAAGSRRLPILEVFGQIGFFLSVTGASLFKARRWRLLAAIFFCVCIYLGGGRVAMVSSIGGILVFLFLRRRFVLTVVVACIVVFGILSMQIIHQMAPNSQVARLTDLGPLDESSVGRYYIYEYGLRAFMENPVFGTGYGQDMDIGHIKIRDKFQTSEFVEKQLRMGGHSTHLALLKNVGLVGYIPFMMMWIAPMLALLPVAMNPRPSGKTELTHWRQAQFVCIYFSALLVRMLVEGNGTELNNYIYLGIAAVILNEILRARTQVPDFARA